MSFKICVYAICKNEEQFVDRWIKAFIDKVDYICVLDTGSTDSTIEKLKSYGSKVIVNQKIYKNFRFDIARKDSMLFIPEDTDICIKSDFDQIWQPQWYDIVVKAFSEGYNVISGPILNYDENGNLIDTTISGDVHFYDKEWTWTYPVHEQLLYKGNKTENCFYDENFIIEHRPNFSKGRSYDKIIENWYKEEQRTLPKGQRSAYCAIYYGNQVNSYDPDLALSIYEDALTSCYFTERDPIFSQLCINIASHKKGYEAVSFLEKAVEKGFLTRNLYVTLAEVLEALNPQKAVFYYEQALTLSYNRFWAENENLFDRGVIESKLSLVYFYLIKDYQKAYDWGLKAYLSPKASDSARSLYSENLGYFKEKISNFKVCIYAICKNEEANIKKWLSQVKEADLIVILDTGSTDESYNLFRFEENEKLHIFQKIYNDFSFATARNDCLSLARKFTDSSSWIFIWLDIDEFPSENFFSEIKRNWTSDLDGMKVLGASFDEKPYWSMKCHSDNPSWYWKFRIHEQPYLQNREMGVENYNIISINSTIYEHKSENAYKEKEKFFREKGEFYYSLNKKQHLETPTEILIFYNLIWDCDNLGLAEEAEHYCRELYDLLISNNSLYFPRVNYSNSSIPIEIRLQIFMRVFTSCEDFLEKERILFQILKAIYNKQIPETRQFYCVFGDFYLNIDDVKAIFFYMKALNVKNNPENITPWCLSSFPTNEEIFNNLKQISNLKEISLILEESL